MPARSLLLMIAVVAAGCTDFADVFERSPRPISAPPTCDPTGCESGCCAPNGTCLPGNVEAACGTGGIQCVICAPGEACSAGTCSSDPPDAGEPDADAGVDAGVPDGGEELPPDAGTPGAPEIELSHANLDFERVGYFPAATTPLRKKRITVTNKGTESLWLTSWRVDALNADTHPDEFEVGPLTRVWPVEIPPAPGSNSVELEVTVRTLTLGSKRAELVLSTDDPLRPEVPLSIVAEVVTVPPCNYSVLPTLVDFGLVPESDVRELAFNVRNNATSPGQVCLLSDLEVLPGANGNFSLVDAPGKQLELAPGEARPFRIRFTPEGPTPPGYSNRYTQIEMQLSSPVKPFHEVNSIALTGPTCLTVSPTSIDFGNTATGCSSPARQVRVYNRCSSTASLSSISPAFSAFSVSGPPLGSTLNRGDSPAIFEATFSPTPGGLDASSVSLGFDQNGVTRSYVVPLFGTRQAQGSGLDQFLIDSARALDVLSVVDDSVAAAQADVAAASSAFAAWAIAEGVDLHAAVTSADMAAGGPQGRLVQGPGHPDTVLDATTLATQLPSKLAAAGAGALDNQCLAAAAAALTPPLFGGDNAGFRRRDAALAVVCISSRAEKSPESHGWYLDALRNLTGRRSAAFSLSAVSGFGASCTIDDGMLEAAADATGGFKLDLCTLDWSQLFLALGRLEERSRETLDLRAPPDLQQGSITVTTNGVPASNWTYDAARNRIVFAPPAAPLPGDLVAVSYPVACL